MMYSEKNTIEMDVSFKLYILSSKDPEVYTVNVCKDDKNKNGYVKLYDNINFPLDKLEVVHLRNHVCGIKRISDSDKNNLKLWKVIGVKSKGIKEQNISTGEDIVKKLSGEEMELEEPFGKYFQNELDNKNKSLSSIITIIPTTAGPLQGVTQGPVARSLEEALSVILRNEQAKIETSSERIEIRKEMPLKERDTDKALTIFQSNVNNSFDRFASKASFNFLVCGGAAGIGKTRWGREFYNSVERNWSPPLSWGEPIYLYLLLDFITGVRLSSSDIYLEASTILGLRVAFDYFVRGKSDMPFEVFKILVKPFVDLFGIEFVLRHIHQVIEPNRKLIVVLHIDEYQEIFAFKDSWKGGLSGKGLFKEILHALGSLMIDCRTKYYVQTFLSGTASRDVIIGFKATEYSFEFVKCPLLKIKSIIEIFDYFAEKEGDKEKLWMRNTKFLQLLYDTNGLPRALETVLNECFKRDRFFLKLKDRNFTLFDDIFHAVINTLTNKYKLDEFIMKNRKACCQLLYHCIGAIPVHHNTKLDSEQTLTVEDLERDGVLIINKIALDSYFIEMLFYFIYIYNMWLNKASATIHKMFQPESEMAWDTWEKFVANYEMFRNNLLFELEQYKEGIFLKEFYRGAIGNVSVLNIRMRLEKLELCEAKNQFPRTGLPRNRLNNEVMDLNGLVIVNGHSAPFGDVVLLRKKTPNGGNLLIAFQQKWYTTSQEFTIGDAINECNKNKDAYKYVKDNNLREFLERAHIVTIIFTSRPFKENPKDLPNDCLIISKENFNQYFGPLFASRLTFDIINDLNINSAEPKRIADVIKGIGVAVSKAIYENGPYKSAAEVIEKVVERNPTYRSYLEEARTQLENCSYTPYSLLDNEDNSMILDESDSLNSNDNVLEMDLEE